MAVSVRESIARISDPQSMDETVEEVLGLMLGWKCVPDPEPLPRDADSVTAVVGFGGVLCGACILRAGADAARAMAAAMMGSEPAEVDESVQDAMGELANVLAGSWKGRVPELAANCGLSVPAVITGRHYNLHVHRPEFELRHCYRCVENSFELTIVCEGLQ